MLLLVCSAWVVAAVVVDVFVDVVGSSSDELLSMAAADELVLFGEFVVVFVRFSFG